jgi:starvation-inducible outer membrane lipoprotein
MNNHTLIFIGIVLLMGCATGPKEIQVANNQQLVNFDNVSDDSVGKIVKWGGVITDLHEQDGVANATITQFPLLLSGQPTYMLGSGGTFTARFKSPLNMDNLEQGTVLTLVGKVEELQNPYPDLKTTQLVIVRTDDFYVWDGFSRSKAPIIYRQAPAFIKRGKWGWQIKSQSEKDRERQERKNERMVRNLNGGVGAH